MTSSAIAPQTQCDVYAAILVSHDDRLTPLTENMVKVHNRIYWCNCPTKRPADFDVKAICNI